jgi:hypothetical protein
VCKIDGEILFASYTMNQYDGTAYVLFHNKGKLYEVEGSHCSCYGLERQWKPQEIPKDVMDKVLTTRACSFMDYCASLREFLGIKKH